MIQKARYSFISYIICISLLLYACFCFYPKWKNKNAEATIGWDVSTYYWYLPSIFVYHDLKHQAFGPTIIDKYHPTPSFDQSYVGPAGNRVITYSSGMAVMYFPFFILAHITAPYFGYPADGFSLPYQFALSMGSLLISFIGLWFFRKLFLKFYSDKVVAILLLILVFGTNYLNYSAIEGSQTHNWLFTLYVLLLLATISFYSKPSYKSAVCIGTLCGLMTLIRPSEVISILIPLLWGLESFRHRALKNKLEFIRSHYRQIITAAICAMLVGSVQVAYWVYVANQPLVYSYQEKTFSWLHPHFSDYMFSYRSGWIRYTPVMLFALIGIIPFLTRGKNKVAILSFFIINLYIVSAWDIWWYGGTGGRAMLQSYPVILFPFASLLQMMSDKKVWKWILTPFLLLFSYFNLWFTYNAHAGQGLYDSEGYMTRAYFWKVIFRYHVPDEVFKLKDTNRIFEGVPKNKRILYQNTFEDDTVQANNQLTIRGKNSLYVAPHSSSPHYNFSIHTDAPWVRAQATFHCMDKEWTAWRMPQFIVRLQKGDSIVQENLVRPDRFLNSGQTADIYVDVKIPDEEIDNVTVFFWNDISDQSFVVDDLRVWSFYE
jgi:hypothetical protein